VPAARTSPEAPTHTAKTSTTGTARTPQIGWDADGVLLVDGARVIEGRSGTVYLLHFHAPFGHARHYLGWAAHGHLADRLAEHAAGRGARLTQVVHAAGIGWTLARTWPGTRWKERSLKRQGGSSRRCPVCGVRPRFPYTPPTQPATSSEPGRPGVDETTHTVGADRTGGQS
jgi:hypothetical protein